MGENLDATTVRTSPREVSLTQLRYFVHAAEMASMTKAAQHLYVAQSAVSSAVAHLEKELGTELFIRRHAKGLVLTSSGRTLLVSARNVLDELATSLDEVAEESQVTRGTLHAACFTPLVPFYIPQILSQFAHDLPEVELHLTEHSLPEIGAAVESGHVEIALTYDRGLPDRVHREVLREVKPYAAVSAEHPLAEWESVTLADLAGYSMVLVDLPHSREYFMQCFVTRGLHPHVQFRSSNYEAVRSLVARTESFALLHQRPEIDATYAGGRIVPLPVKDEVEPLSVVLASLKGFTMSARAKAFAEQARKVVSHG